MTVRLRWPTSVTCRTPAIEHAARVAAAFAAGATFDLLAPAGPAAARLANPITYPAGTAGR